MQAKSGFTLIEILIALVIVGIMAAIAVPAINTYRERARRRAVVTDLQSLQLAIDAFYDDVGQYPPALRDLVRKPQDPEMAAKWTGPAFKGAKLPRDPWGKAYQYKVTPDGDHPYELYSYGPKGKKAPKAERFDAWK